MSIRALTSASALALLFGLAGHGTAFAQQSPDTVDRLADAECDPELPGSDCRRDRVVITGSNIAGAAESAALVAAPLLAAAALELELEPVLELEPQAARVIATIPVSAASPVFLRCMLLTPQRCHRGGDRPELHCQPRPYLRSAER